MCFKGTKRKVSVNICSEEGNSADISRLQSVTWNFRNKGKTNAYYFRRDKTAILGTIKAQLPFSEGKHELLNSWNKISFPRIFYHMTFQLPHPNRSNSVSSQKYPFKRQYNDMRKRKTGFYAFPHFISLGAPGALWFQIAITTTRRNSLGASKPSISHDCNCNAKRNG